MTESSHSRIVPPDSSRGPRWEYDFAALLGMAFMTAVQSGSWGIAGNDGYYHVKMALMLPEVGYVQSFPWLHWTIFRDQFVSHHHGFHTLLAPFVRLAQMTIGDPALGGKLASILAMGATFALVAAMLRKLQVPNRWLWLLIIGAAPWHFWLRQAYVRAPMAGLPLLLLAVLWHLRGRTLAVGLLGFVFTQVYGGGVLFPLVSIAFLGGAWLNGETIRLPFRQCLFAVAGVVLGFVINPYFPANLGFFITQIFVTGLGAPAEVGSEWKPYVAWNLVMQSAVLGVVYFACLLRRLKSAAPTRSDELALFLLNLAFLLLTLKSRRFVEYWPVFAVISAAAFHTRALQATGLASQPVSLSRKRWHRRALLASGIGVGVCAAVNLWISRDNIQPSHDLSVIRDALTFLRVHSPPGSLVFTDDWDIFPSCFYFNHHNTYAVGLDPEFTRTRYPALWERYRRITRAELPAKLEETTEPDGNDEILYDDIATCFQADYVLVAADHRPLFKALNGRSKQFTVIYPPDWKAGSAQPAITLFQVQSKSNQKSVPD